MAQMDCNILHI